MVKPPPTIALCAIFFIMLGCASEDRVAKLEKQVDELGAESKKNQAAADFDLQGKCAKDSRGWFNENWSRDKDTILLDYSNHYNRAQNKCFVLVELHYTLDKSGSWTGDMMLWDVYENTKYGNFAENHMISFNPTVSTHDEVVTCEVLNNRCKTVAEFNDLVVPYLKN